MYMHIYMCVYIYINIYIYIERERERDGGYIHISAHTFILQVSGELGLTQSLT